MIEATLKDTKKKRVIKYPCLMKGCLGSIVAFTSEGVGTLLTTDSISREQLYKSSDGWIMSDFVIYEGSLTFKNK